MHSRIALLASTAAAALALAAPAEAGNWTGFYIGVTGGANWSDDTDFTVGPFGSSIFTWNSDPDTGYFVGAAIGSDLGQMMSGLRVEGEAGYRSNSVDGVWLDNIAASPTTGLLDYDQDTFSVLVNLWLDIPVGGVEPYIGGGIGWADTNAEGSYICVAGGCAGTAIPFDFSDDGFAWQAGAGINFPISPNMKLGVGYRYFEGPEPTAVGPISGLTHDLDNGNHTATVTLTFGM
jgi:opacity protein-like surface antigen